MSCLRNALGQPLCNVVDHPDNAGESFCATCNKRFQSRFLSAHSQSNPGSNQQLSSVLTDIITGVLALFLAAIVNSFVRDAEVQLPPAQDAAVHSSVLAASEESAKYLKPSRT